VHISSLKLKFVHKLVGPTYWNWYLRAPTLSSSHFICLASHQLKQNPFSSSTWLLPPLTQIVCFGKRARIFDETFRGWSPPTSIQPQDMVISSPLSCFVPISFVFTFLRQPMVQNSGHRDEILSKFLGCYYVFPFSIWNLSNPKHIIT